MEEVVFGIDIQSSNAEKNLASLTAKIADNRKLLREQKKVLDEVNKTYGVGSKQSIQAAKGVDQLTAETKGLVSEQKQQVKQGDIVAGSLNDQRNQLNKLIKQYDNIPQGTKASKALEKQIVSLTAKVKTGEQATERFGRGVGNYRNNVREALKETGLFSRQLRTLESVQNTTSKVFGTSTKSAGLFAAGLGGIAVAAVAVFKIFSEGIKVFRDFTKASSDLQAILGTTKEGVSALNEDAKRLGSTTEFTASQVTKLQTEFAKLGFSTQEILNATESTLGFASATGVELPRAATLAGSAVRAFGLDSKDTARVVDVLTKSTTISALDFTKLETAIAQVAPVAKNAGVSIEETTALLGTLSDAGVDASTAGTGLRNILLDVADKGLDFNEALEDINSSTDKNARSLELFGKRGAVVATIIAENQEKTAQYSDTLENSFGTAVDIANQKLDNLDGDLTKLSSAWEGLLLNLTEGNGLFGKLTRGAVQLTTSFVGLFNSQEKQLT